MTPLWAMGAAGTSDMIGGAASPLAGAPGSLALQPGSVAVARPSAASPPGAPQLWAAVLQPATTRASNGSVPAGAAIVPGRGGSGRLPAATSTSCSRRASTSTPRWRDAEGPAVAAGSAPLPNLSSVPDVNGQCSPPGPAASPPCPAPANQASTYSPWPPGMGPVNNVPPGRSPRDTIGQSPRTMSPHPGAPGLMSPAPPPHGGAGGGYTNIDVQRRLADLERSMRDLRLDMDRSRKQVINELGRFGATVQQLDTCFNQPPSIEELRIEVADLRRSVDLRQSPAAGGDLSSRSSSPAHPLAASGGGCQSARLLHLPASGTDGACVPAMLAASLDSANQGELCEVVRAALSELERLSRMACEGLEAASADHLSLLRPGVKASALTEQATSDCKAAVVPQQEEPAQPRCRPTAPLTALPIAAAGTAGPARCSPRAPSPPLSSGSSSGGGVAVSASRRAEDFAKLGETGTSFSSSSTAPPRMEGDSRGTSTSTSPRYGATTPSLDGRDSTATGSASVKDLEISAPVPTCSSTVTLPEAPTGSTASLNAFPPGTAGGGQANVAQATWAAAAGVPVFALTARS